MCLALAGLAAAIVLLVVATREENLSIAVFLPEFRSEHISGFITIGRRKKSRKSELWSVEHIDILTKQLSFVVSLRYRDFAISRR